MPKRFRDYIAGLERELSGLRDLLREEPASAVYFESHQTAQKRYLPDGTRISFMTKLGEIEVCLDSRRVVGGLALTTPDGRLEILPDVSNCITVVVGHR